MEAPNQRESVLLSDYNYFRGYTRSRQQAETYSRNVGMKRAEPYLREMADWCVAQGIDPRRWLYFRFVSRHWTFPPPLRQLKPSKKSERKALSAFHEMTAAPAYGHRISTGIQYQRDPTGVVWDVNRDLSAVAEALKRRYVRAGQTARCIDEQEEKTFGYHPKSRVCPSCPAAGACYAKLQARVCFDILALRRGDIDLQSCYDKMARQRF